jgi:Zn-finger protein
MTCFQKLLSGMGISCPYNKSECLFLSCYFLFNYNKNTIWNTSQNITAIFPCLDVLVSHRKPDTWPVLGSDSYMSTLS